MSKLQIKSNFVY